MPPVPRSSINAPPGIKPWGPELQMAFYFRITHGDASTIGLLSVPCGKRDWIIACMIGRPHMWRVFMVRLGRADDDLLGKACENGDFAAVVLSEWPKTDEGERREHMMAWDTGTACHPSSKRPFIQDIKTVESIPNRHYHRIQHSTSSQAAALPPSSRNGLLQTTLAPRERNSLHACRPL